VEARECSCLFFPEEFRKCILKPLKGQQQVAGDLSPTPATSVQDLDSGALDPVLKERSSGALLGWQPLAEQACLQGLQLGGDSPQVWVNYGAHVV
jgi:hypothetical protein